eukprot:13356333-Alexandrium_andersonii.AAC.1
MKEDAALSVPIARPNAHDRSPVPHPAPPPPTTPAGGRGIQLTQCAAGERRWGPHQGPRCRRA